MIINKEYKIKINSIYKQLAEIKTKDIYWELLITVAERPTSEQSWNDNSELLLTEEEWKTIYKMAYKLTKDTKLINFNFKVTHRILAVGERLKTWKIKDTDKCEVCNEKDTVEHFLVTCQEVLSFWQQVFNWWQSLTNIRFPLLVYEILFGIPNDSNEILITHFNYVLLNGNYYIYKNKMKQEKLHLYEFIMDCKNRLKLETKILEDKTTRVEKIDQWKDLNILLGNESNESEEEPQ
jgi:hypothetical protein